MGPLASYVEGLANECQCCWMFGVDETFFAFGFFNSHLKNRWGTRSPPFPTTHNHSSQSPPRSVAISFRFTSAAHLAYYNFAGRQTPIRLSISPTARDSTCSHNIDKRWGAVGEPLRNMGYSCCIVEFRPNILAPPKHWQQCATSGCGVLQCSGVATGSSHHWAA